MPRASVPKTGAAETLLLACGVVASGGVYVPPHALLVLHDGGAPAAPTVALTPRQRDVLALLMDGEPNKRIAQRLGLTEGTVKLHIAALLRAPAGAQPHRGRGAGASAISKGIAQAPAVCVPQRRSPRVDRAQSPRFDLNPGEPTWKLPTAASAAESVPCGSPRSSCWWRSPLRLAGRRRARQRTALVVVGAVHAEPAATAVPEVMPSIPPTALDDALPEEPVPTF